MTEEQNGRLEKKQIPFQDVRSVRRIKSVKPSHTTRNILIGVGIAVVVIGGLLAAMAAGGPIGYN